MKKLPLLLVALLSLASLSAEPIKIKFNDLSELGAALRALDGSEKEVKTSDQGTRIIRVPLDLKPAARIAIARDLGAVRTALEAFESQRQVILQRVSPGAIERIQTDPALLGKFSTAWTALTADPITIDVVFLTEEQLNLEANREISGSVLAGLSPVLSLPKK